MALWGGLMVGSVLLGAKAGVLLGTAPWGRARLYWLALAAGACLVLLVALLGTRQEVLVDWLNRYTFLGAVVAGALLVWLGLTDAGGTRTSRGLAAVLSALPCPLCLVALALGIALLAGALNLKALALAPVVALFLSGTTAAFGAAAGRVPGVERAFGNLCLLLGLFTLSCALVIPNLVAAMTMPARPVTLPGPAELAAVAAGAAALWLCGYLRAARRRWPL
ncbi:MAG: DUF2162 family putative transporter [Desulfotomaculales bacterium]